MRAIVQRVSSAAVHIEGKTHSSIGKGLLVYIGVGHGDDMKDLELLVDKISHLRIFSDEAGKMNLDVGRAGGEVLVVSAFTVQADTRRGRRPSFDAAAPPQEADPMIQRFCRTLSDRGLTVKTGVFRAYMDVESHNDGPICILLDTKPPA